MKTRDIIGICIASIGVLLFSILLPVILPIAGAILIGQIIYTQTKGVNDE
jgi:CHASE2 domain-containing sensor protein